MLALKPIRALGLVWMLLPLSVISAAEPDQADLQVLIDISGSMKENDPANLRSPALKLLMNLAPTDSRLGVKTFGQAVNSLVPAATVSPEWKQGALPKADQINSRGLFTNIGAALSAALADVPAGGADAWSRQIVLLSDGMVDISKDPAANVTETQRILEELVPKLKAAAIKVHAVALSDGSDKAFLEALAMATGGSFRIANSADDLMNLFVSAADKVNKPDLVPLVDNEFTIDDSVREFTALLFHKPDSKKTMLIAPSGKEYSQVQASRNVSWFADPRYDLITVYNPEAGRWQVRAEMEPGARVTVISDLELEMGGLPEHAVAGEQLEMQMRFTEDERTILNPQFLELLDITFQQRTDAGEEFEGKLSGKPGQAGAVPDDGIYTARLGRTITPGEHQFSVIVDGKTFRRKKTASMTVHAAVVNVQTEYTDASGITLQQLQLTPESNLIKPEAMTVLAQLTAPDGAKSVAPVQVAADGRWELPVPASAQPGVHEVLLKISGETVNGNPFELIQGPIQVDYSDVTATVAEGEAQSAEPAAEAEVPVELAAEFDPESMEIPDLDVEEVPPEDVMPEPVVMPPDTLAEPIVTPEPDAPVDLLPASSEEAVVSSNTDEGGPNWLMIALVALGNLVLVSGGVIYYLKYLRRRGESSESLMEEITQMQTQREQSASAEPEEVEAEAETAESEIAAIEDEDEATVVASMEAIESDESDSAPESAEDGVVAGDPEERADSAPAAGELPDDFEAEVDPVVTAGALDDEPFDEMPDMDTLAGFTTDAPLPGGLEDLDADDTELEAVAAQAGIPDGMLDDMELDEPELDLAEDLMDANIDADMAASDEQLDQAIDEMLNEVQSQNKLNPMPELDIDDEPAPQAEPASEATPVEDLGQAELPDLDPLEAEAGAAEEAAASDPDSDTAEALEDIESLAKSARAGDPGFDADDFALDDPKEQ